MFHVILKRFSIGIITVSFVLQSIVPSNSQMAVVSLPVPGTLVLSSQASYPMVLKGVTIHPDNPLQLDFVLDTGDSGLSGEEAQQQAQRLVDYFMASLTVPSGDLWVNLSPIEHDRIVPEDLGRTELGRDMLAQDYILKQLTASLMHPEQELGKMFWSRLADEAYKRYGITELPENPFHKVWIMPDHARVYEQGTSVYVIDGHLKVMLEEDYLMGEKDVSLRGAEGDAAISDISSQKMLAMTGTKDILKGLIRDIILPEIEKEVNTGANFAALRQIYNSLILAKWYKEKIKNSDLSALYVDQNKVSGVDLKDTQYKEQIYQQYVQAYKQGVFDFIKDDYDPASSQMVSRKYFSGGIQDAVITTDLGSLAELKQSFRGPANRFTMALNPRVPSAAASNAAMLNSYLSTDKDINDIIPESSSIKVLNRKQYSDIYDVFEKIKFQLGITQNIELRLISTQEPIFGGYKHDEESIYLDKSYIEKMRNQDAYYWRERLFVYLLSNEDTRLKKLKREYEYARDQLKIDTHIFPQKKETLETLLQKIGDQIILKNFDKQVFSNDPMFDPYDLPILSPGIEAKELSERLWLRGEESLYQMAIDVLNNQLKPKSPVRLSEKDPEDLVKDQDVNIGLFAFAANPITLAHLIVVMFGGMAKAKVNNMIATVTKGDFRKRSLRATFFIRNFITKKLLEKVGGGLIKTLTFPKKDDDGINGEEKIWPLILLNKLARSIRLVYTAGQDHNLVFYRNVRTGLVDFETITKENKKDFEHYMKNPHYREFLRMMLEHDPEGIADEQQWVKGLFRIIQEYRRDVSSAGQEEWFARVMSEMRNFNKTSPQEARAIDQKNRFDAFMGILRELEPWAKRYHIDWYKKMMEEIRALGPVPQERLRIWQELIDTEDPVKLLVPGFQAPKLDTIGKLWLTQQQIRDEFPDKEFNLVFMYTERKGEHREDKFRDWLKFPTIVNKGVDGKISSTRLRNGFEKMMIEKLFSLDELFAVPKDILSYLLKLDRKSRQYLYSLIRFYKRIFSMNIERLFPLSQEENDESHKKLRDDLADALARIHQSLKVSDQISHQENYSIVTVSNEALDDANVFEFHYKIRNGLSPQALGDNSIVEHKFEVNLTQAKDKMKLTQEQISQVERLLLDYALQLNDAHVADHAMFAGPIVIDEDGIFNNSSLVSTNGGIDMNAIELDGSGESSEIEFDPAILESLRETGINGFVPVISHFRAVGLADILK